MLEPLIERETLFRNIHKLTVINRLDSDMVRRSWQDRQTDFALCNQSAQLVGKRAVQQVEMILFEHLKLPLVSVLLYCVAHNDVKLRISSLPSPPPQVNFYHSTMVSAYLLLLGTVVHFFLFRFHQRILTRLLSSHHASGAPFSKDPPSLFLESGESGVGEMANGQATRYNGRSFPGSRTCFPRASFPHPGL